MSESTPTEVHGEVVAVDPQDQAMVRAAPGDVVVAFEEYRKIQQGLDAALPDCVITIQGNKFRKKNYWRAVATAFNLTVKLTTEERTEVGDDWGYLVMFTAMANNGRSADGDGSCFWSEKKVYLWRNGKRTDEVDLIKTAENATVHNIRAHAHTRAYNRAVSNLVGFGEVSAEEMMQEKSQGLATPPQATGGRKITEPQRRRMYKLGGLAADRLEVPAEQVDEFAKAMIQALGFESSKDLTREPYDTLCNKLEALTLNDLVPPTEQPGGTEDEEPPF